MSPTSASTGASTLRSDAPAPGTGRSGVSTRNGHAPSPASKPPGRRATFPASRRCLRSERRIRSGMAGARRRQDPLRRGGGGRGRGLGRSLRRRGRRVRRRGGGRAATGPDRPDRGRPARRSSSSPGAAERRQHHIRSATGVPDGIWKTAAVVVEGVYNSQLLAPSPMEARAFLAAPELGGGLTVWCSHQAPHRLRALLAQALEMEEHAVRVIVPDVGGAFGGKSQLYPEYVVVAHLARLLGRPVRWVEDRRESLVAASTSRGQNQWVRIAADGDGTILAVEAELDVAVGAYPHIGEGIGINTAQMICGAYAVPNAAVMIQGGHDEQRAHGRLPRGGPPGGRLRDGARRRPSRERDPRQVDPADLRRANFKSGRSPTRRRPAGSTTAATTSRHSIARSSSPDTSDLRAEAKAPRRIGYPARARSGSASAATSNGPAEISGAPSSAASRPSPTAPSSPARAAAPAGRPMRPPSRPSSRTCSASIPPLVQRDRGGDTAAIPVGRGNLRQPLAAGRWLCAPSRLDGPDRRGSAQSARPPAGGVSADERRRTTPASFAPASARR